MTKEELFNLWHVSTWNIIERIFSILKCQFQILLLAPEYDVDVQACIPVVLCTLHNFIYSCNENEEDDVTSCSIPMMKMSITGSAMQVDDLAASRLWDDIAVAMWNNYQAILVERAQRSIDLDSGSDFFEEEVTSTL
ncbi:hypothetical protein PISMIDRAFT_101734 [Pisolithus microcarpus 441]|uniref:DDE Tnp4 domain-containing protein n=1 Tax=Pisolithus microcarpus 441 TaxID=765257 RepID=A0A0C9Z1C6_9AGAM|nr:hypothetical protein BKA83DRAFT_101734 [Pisolithus microcarpus]KIK22871.1 hypothetical protein PISMIDRAFT_101734 [Pisolithus microcarpus 441]